MAPLDSNVRKLPEPAAPQYRNAPQNIEAEQALLGAIIVNNEAFYRVSDFLEPQHFFEPIHQQIYELASNLIRAGKTATPVTLKTFLPTDMDIGGLNASQYLARLAAEATTVINAADYGRTVYDMAIRRALMLPSPGRAMSDSAGEASTSGVTSVSSTLGIDAGMVRIPSPVATASANSRSTFIRPDTIRSRMAGVCTRVSSKRNALIMCARSGGV